MISADLREEVTCPICLSIYRDPVTLSCGHNYCLGCIESVLGTQEGSGLYSCPECRKRFSNRPELQRNIALCNVMMNLQNSKPEQKDNGVFCTYCIHSPVPATKSCLLCEASLCDAHLSVHSKSEEHVLTEPTTSWGNRKCSIHRELLEYYCTEDAACICVTCSQAGEHRGHQVELLNEASEKKKERLRDVLQKLTTKRQNIIKRVQSLQGHRRGVQEKAAGVTERLTALIRDIRKQLEDLEKRVLDDFCGAEKGDNEVTQTGDKQVTAEGELDEGLISVTLYRGLDEIENDIKVKKSLYVQVTSDILLAMETSGNTILSDTLETCPWSERYRHTLDTPERFTDLQVLSTTSFSSGQHYWEIETSGLSCWKIGMCYTSMEKKGYQSRAGNNKSWFLCEFNRKYSVIHNSVETRLPYIPCCDKLGIYLDYEAGRLSFYEMCDPIRHLHTFTTTFSEPLQAVFLV
ncbi:E3 ubiquitin/ISG15 ligase TRIM25-like [Bombina bombina]|uniref:E3 ubiquitin/ISG15 ligase TRIM25-like n=1 Tax=Bombina bombina TaxID=8345 RepID=UPI00235A75BB|nr:E3 ubiquitin/ISG15 ligase TRIM25-like [Bombina bombina]